MCDSCSSGNEKEDSKQPSWKRRSQLEKGLIFLSAVALLVTIIVVIVLIILSTRKSTTCLSPSCIRVSSELMEYMNTSIDPCDDFYQFSCGSFLTNTKLNGSPFKAVDFSILEDVKKRIQEIIEEPQTDNDSRSIVLAKQLYKACTDKESAVEGRGLKLIKESLRKIGGWPVLEGSNWNEKEFEWKSATYKLRELGYGFEFFILMHITLDERNSQKRIIELDKPLGLLYNPSFGFFNELIIDMAVTFGADKTKAIDAFKEVLEFQKALFMSPNENENHNKQFFKVSELQYKFRDIPWLDYINRLQFLAPNISYDQIVSVGNEAYFLKLKNVLRATPKRVVANYIAWSTVFEQSISYLTTETWMWDLLTRYDPSRNIEDVVPPRAKICSELADRLFAWPLKVAYVQKYLFGNAKAHVIELLQNIKDEFKEAISDLEWMDKTTRAKAVEKITSSKNYVVFTNDLMNIDKMEERYMGIQVYQDNLLGSLLNVNYHMTNLRFQKLHEPIDTEEEVDTKQITSIHSYYSEEDNIIRVPAGLLQGIFYDEKRPKYLNYGALGSTLGVPVYHVVFEDFESNSKNYRWLSMQARTSYEDKLSCVAEHYGKYLVPEINQHLNSSKTRHADLADVAAVKLAYNAYEKWENDNGPEQNLPGLDFTPKQLFWISSAIRFCRKSIPRAIEDVVEHYSTSPSKYRVLGVLRNSAEFSDDFNCPADSYMNDKNKCDIW